MGWKKLGKRDHHPGKNRHLLFTEALRNVLATPRYTYFPSLEHAISRGGILRKLLLILLTALAAIASAHSLPDAGDQAEIAVQV